MKKAQLHSNLLYQTFWMLLILHKIIENFLEIEDTAVEIAVKLHLKMTLVSETQ